MPSCASPSPAIGRGRERIPAVGDRLIGVDVGGTKVSVAVFTDGELAEPQVERTELDSPDALLDQLVRMIQAAAGDEDVAAVGLGVPSVIDWETGRVRS